MILDVRPGTWHSYIREDELGPAALVLVHADALDTLASEETWTPVGSIGRRGSQFAIFDRAALDEPETMEHLRWVFGPGTYGEHAFSVALPNWSAPLPVLALPTKAPFVGIRVVLDA